MKKIGLFLLVTSFSAHAETLLDALVGAYKNNPDLLATRQNVIAQHQQITQAKAGYLPQVTSEIGIKGTNATTSGSAKTMGVTGATDQQSSSRYGQVQAVQNLFAGGKTAATVLNVDKTIRSYWAQLLTKEQDTFTNVIKAYLDLIAKIATVDAYRGNCKALQKFYETSFEKQKIGEETITQVANAEAKLAKGEADLRGAEADLESAKAKYTSLTGLDYTNLEKPEPPKGLPETLDAALSLAIDNHPSVIDASYQHEAAKANIDKANGDFMPSVDLVGTSSRDEGSTRSKGYSLEYQRSYDQRSSNYTTNNQLQLRVQYNLYNGGSYSSAKRQAHDTAVARRLNIENTKITLKANLTQAWQGYFAAKANIANYKKKHSRSF
jgi:TolC family type I secretion outer membrane protein